MAVTDIAAYDSRRLPGFIQDGAKGYRAVDAAGNGQGRLTTGREVSRAILATASASTAPAVNSEVS